MLHGNKEGQILFLQHQIREYLVIYLTDLKQRFM